MLVDSVTITVIAGNGGNGAATFRRDAITAHGGPDGGDGGKGGSIYFQGSNNVTDLREFRFRKTIEADRGVDGARHNAFGKNAEDKIVFVPVGTEIVDIETKQSVDIVNTKNKILIVKGGIGGRGNVFFKSAIDRAPRKRELGGRGERRVIHLELRLIAEIGLIGLPNAGKSSLLAALTHATPAIGDYPFTTIEPNIGMLGIKAIADIPGLIEGAASGKGLGVKFLKHIEKTKILIHCIDSGGDDLKKAYETVRNEFELYNPTLLEKQEIVFLNKTDLVDAEKIRSAKEVFTRMGKTVIVGSTRDQKTIDELKKICLSL